jgi:hypothetical protein
MKLTRLLMPVLVLTASLASAESLNMNTGDPAAGNSDVPTRGMHMSQVEARFGAPATRHAAVGKPPITRWDYPGFSVFFEYDHVIHAVTARPAPQPEPATPP